MNASMKLDCGMMSSVCGETCPLKGEGSRGKVPVTNCLIESKDEIDGITDLVREVVSLYRERRHKFDEAAELAAGDLGITHRRVRQYQEGDVYRIAQSEAQGIRRGHGAYLMSHVEWLENRAAQIRARVQA